MTEPRRCGEPAVYRYTWPGQKEAFCCIEHGQQLKKVAEACGFTLELIVFDHDDLPKIFKRTEGRIPFCSQIMKEK